MRFSGWVVRSKFITRIASVFFPVAAITLFPFVIVNPEYEDEVLIRHERIHIAQQMELLVLGFYLLYLWDWFKHLILTGRPYEAYQTIRFEQEAYDNQEVVGYLDNRQAYAWRKYTQE